MGTDIARPIRDRPRCLFIVLVALAGWLAPGSGFATDEPLFDLILEAPTGYEEYPFVAAARYSNRPLEESAEGYSPAVTPEGGTPLPTIWEEPIELVWDLGDGTGQVSTRERPVATSRVRIRSRKAASSKIRKVASSPTG